MPKADAVPRRLREHLRQTRLALLRNALDEPEPTAEPQHLAGSERLVRRIAMYSRLSARRLSHYLVRLDSVTGCRHVHLSTSFVVNGRVTRRLPPSGRTACRVHARRG